MPLASSLVAPALCSLVDGCHAAHPYDAESAVTQGKPACVDIRWVYGNSFRLPAAPAMLLFTHNTHALKRCAGVQCSPKGTTSTLANEPKADEPEHTPHPVSSKNTTAHRIRERSPISLLTMPTGA